MGDGHVTGNPLYHPATSPGRDDHLHALADDVQRRKTHTRWVRENTKAHPERMRLWVTASGDERSKLEEQWEAEDAADEAARKKAKQVEGERRQRVIDARARLRA